MRPDEIEAARQIGWAKDRARALTSVPGPNRFAIQKVLEEPPFSLDRDTFLNGVELFFAARTAGSRSKFFRTVFPGLAPHFEAAWEGSTGRPYQSGLERLPFRAPHRANLHKAQRARWFIAACGALRGLDVDLEWFVRNAGYLPAQWRDPQWGGWLIGTALRAPDSDRIRSVAHEVLRGGAEVGVISRDLIVGLLNSDQREDWEVVGDLLVAAQRQEGLRQTVLESVDEANPYAFRYMLDLILEHRIDRFSSATRALNVWLGAQWTGARIHDSMVKLTALGDDEAVDRALKDGSGEDVYLALWSLAYLDAEAAITRARGLLADPDVERRFAALLTVVRIGLLPESLDIVAERLTRGREEDVRVQMLMVDFLSTLHFLSTDDALFDAVASLFDHAPKTKRKLDPILWPWFVLDHHKRTIGRALRALATGNAQRIVPYASALESHDCVAVIQELSGTGFVWKAGKRFARKRKRLAPEARRLVIELTGDTRASVQKAAFEALAPLPVEPDEVEHLVSVLHRKAAALRVGAIRRLLELPDDAALEVAGRLLADGDAKRRAAGSELLAEMMDAGRSTESARSLLGSEEAPGSPVSDSREESEGAVDSADPFLGLLPSRALSIPTSLATHGTVLETKGAKATLRELSQLLVDHADQEVETHHGTTPERVLLGQAGFRLPTLPSGTSLEEARSTLPLGDVWIDWLDQRAGPRDPDGLDFVRAWAWAGRGSSYLALLPGPFRRSRNWSIEGALKRILSWMVTLEPGGAPDRFLVDYFEDGVAGASRSAEERADAKGPSFGPGDWLTRRHNTARRFFQEFDWLKTPESQSRLGVLELLAIAHGRDRQAAEPPLRRFAAAFDAGLVSEHDLVWFLLHPRTVDLGWGPTTSYGPIRDVTRLRRAPEIEQRPALVAVAERVRTRIVEVELQRRDLPGPASGPARDVKHAGGLETFFKLVESLGTAKIVRHYEWGEASRAGSLSRLIAVTKPEKGDTPQRFKERFTRSSIKAKRMLELAMYAPQWAGHIETALDHRGLAEAAWWIHAHTKQNAYWKDRDFRAEWLSTVSERTELEATDLEEGAVDVRWFRAVIDQIGPDAWAELARPARYASNSGGHKRAQLFGDAMLGIVSEEELGPRVDEKRHQDAVRALGLLPLPSDADDRADVTLSRFEWLHRFLKESRKFGSQRQASEARAVDIGLQNLARSAGYRDPQRLTWAMERVALQDLVDGPIVVEEDDVRVALCIDDDGDPALAITRGERSLKNVPAALRKHRGVKDLRERLKTLRSQRSRMRESLEAAMVKGHELEGVELRSFFDHPMLRPRIERLVLLGEGDAIGYPVEEGRALRDAEGTVHPVGPKEPLRLVHPIDLLRRGDWHTWLRDCFQSERIQPFKQLFREVYPKSPDEREQELSRRYGGHQVNPGQALGLFKRRQWISAPEEGVKRTFHDHRLVATVLFEEAFYTPADVEGLTLHGVQFHRPGDENVRLRLSEVPDRLFSEVMRDLDLVVSVAHAGGVDPEASSSTIEMRSALVGETVTLLGLDNVRVEGHHAHIEGSRAEYAVHLGSANASVLPGRALVIVAVHSQHRGRLFLPFADEDPKSAEVLSKVLLLARDGDIKDPAILRQIEQ